MRVRGILRRPAARRTALRLSADVLGRLLQLVVLIALARRFDEATFGTLMVGATAGLIIAQLADIGLSLVVGSDIARRLPTSAAALGTALRVKVALSALGVGGALVLYPLLGATPAAGGAALLAAALSLDTFVQFATMQLRALFAFRLDWVCTLLPRALSLAVVVPVVVWRPDPVLVGLAWLAAAAAGAAAATAVLRSQLAPGMPSGAIARDLLARSWPIGLSIVISMLYTRVAIFLLQGIRGSEDVAEYAVALRFLEPMYLVPAAMTAVFYPAYARTLAEAPSAAGDVLGRWAGALAVSGVAAYAGLALFGVPLAVLFFGPTFEQSGELLRVLGLVLVPGYVSFLLNQALIARGQARYNLVVMAGLLVVSLTVNAWVIGAHGPWGAAAVAVVVELLLLVALASRLISGRLEPAHG